MNELPQTQPQLVRKTAYGRTELFLPSTSTLVREVKCMGGIQKYDTASVYHMIPSVHEQAGVCCWHCCEPIADARHVIPLPRIYDTAERVYHVYGATCSPACAKAYVLEHTSFDRGQHLNVLIKMLRDVYGITAPVVTAPPRAAMRRFGGHFDACNAPRAECALLQPPFVSYCMLVEERNVEDELAETTPADESLPLVSRSTAIAAPPLANAAGVSMEVEEADIFDEPHPPGIYQDYLKEMERETIVSAESMSAAEAPEAAAQAAAVQAAAAREAAENKPEARKAGERNARPTKRPGDAASTGPLSRFVKPR